MLNQTTPQFISSRPPSLHTGLLECWVVNLPVAVGNSSFLVVLCAKLCDPVTSFFQLLLRHSKDHTEIVGVVKTLENKQDY